jgi:hypothetical protein
MNVFKIHCNQAQKLQVQRTKTYVWGKELSSTQYFTQCRNPLVHDTYMTVSEKCRGCELEPHLGKFMSDTARAVFTHGPKEPGPRAANFQWWHVKRNRD